MGGVGSSGRRECAKDGGEDVDKGVYVRGVGTL